VSQRSVRLIGWFDIAVGVMSELLCAFLLLMSRTDGGTTGMIWAAIAFGVAGVLAALTGRGFWGRHRWAWFVTWLNALATLGSGAIILWTAATGEPHGQRVEVAIMSAPLLAVGVTVILKLANSSLRKFISADVAD
jgi:hypothetical protein